VPRQSDESYDQGALVTEIFPKSVTGILTARDGVVFDMDRALLLERTGEFRDETLADDVLRNRHFGPPRSPRYERGDTRGWKLPEARAELRKDTRWRERAVRCLYRPFDVRWLYYSPTMVDWPRPDLMPH